MRIFTKIMAALGVVSLKSISIAMSVTAKVCSILTGPFLVFVIGCGIYCVVTTNWKSLLILTIIGGAVVSVFMLTGLLLGLLDIAQDRMKQVIRN